MTKSTRFNVDYGNAGVYFIDPGEDISKISAEIDTTNGGWLVIDASGDPANLTLIDTENEALDLAHGRS